jgi:hypothetical protein
MKPSTSNTNKTIPPHRQFQAIPAPPRAALQTREAASYIGVSELTLKRLAYRGLLNPNRALGRLLWPVKQLDAFLADPRTCDATRRGSDGPQNKKG